MHSFQKVRINDVYALINNDFEAGTNPVKKMHTVVTGYDGEVYMDEIPEVVQGNGGNGGGNGDSGNGCDAASGGFIDRPIREQLLAMHSKLHRLRRSDEELRQIIQQLPF